jgi:hypothetical protein
MTTPPIKPNAPGATVVGTPDAALEQNDGSETVPVEHRALMLRTCKVVGGRLISPSHDACGFEWPRSGLVECPDWKPSVSCGNGLHGLLWGEGDPGVWEMDGAWLVCMVDAREIVDVGWKIKAPRAWVVFVGDRVTAHEYIRARDTIARPGYASMLTGGYASTLTGGHRSMLTGGNRSTLTGGNRSMLTGGDDSTLTGGYRSTLTGGNRSMLTGGNRSTLTGGYDSTLTGGNRSTLTGGYASTLTGGYDSTLTGGYDSTLTGGNRSTLTGGYASTLTGGYDSTLIFRWLDGAKGRCRVSAVEVDGATILPGVAYRCTGGVVAAVGGAK